jgi:hypothetical protein
MGRGCFAGRGQPRRGVDRIILRTFLFISRDYDLNYPAWPLRKVLSGGMAKIFEIFASLWIPSTKVAMGKIPVTGLKGPLEEGGLGAGRLKGLTFNSRPHYHLATSVKKG